MIVSVSLLGLTGLLTLFAKRIEHPDQLVENPVEAPKELRKQNVARRQARPAA